MTLNDSIIKICKENFTEENDWYSWREINESKLPDSIILPKGNQFAKNMALKEALHSKWKNEPNIEKREEYIEYYIKAWGGIKTNRANSMNEYKTKSAEELIKKGRQGIASWSKALVLHDHNQYAIFDARVAISLNCLQMIDSVDNKILYPILASRNSTIIPASKKLKAIAKIEGWDNCDDSTFYRDYLELLKKTANELNTNISTVEMLLFAKAEELIHKSFND